MQIQPIYAGIGSRKTPLEILSVMTHMADYLASRNWLLRSGHADGADKAFEKGVKASRPRNMEIHLPWDGYNNTRAGETYIVPTPTVRMVQIAADHHPMWDAIRADGTPVLSKGAKMLMIRNVSIILGKTLDQPANCVIGWTPNGSGSGGTGMGYRVAKTFGIPVFDIALDKDRKALSQFVVNEQEVAA